MHPTPLKRASHESCVGARVMRGVSRFLNKNSNRGLFEIESKDAPRYNKLARA